MIARVVHLASGREWRGGQRQVWLLARELTRLDVPQIVVTGGRGELARRLRRDGVPLRSVPWSVGVDPRVLPGLLNELRATPSLVHAHDAHAVALGGLAAMLARRPLVATRRVDFHLRRRGYWGRAARVIAISEAVARVLGQDGISPERIAVVHSGIAVDEVRRTLPLGIRARLGLPADALIAANVAALVGHKDHATLLRAAALLRDTVPLLHWVIAGEGIERPSLERLRVQLGLERRVHLLGHLDEPARLVADASCFVMSSREEGLGTSVLEAMALGIPVASTTAGGLPEMLQDGAGLLVPPGDPVALAAAVARLVGDPALAQDLAGKAEQRVAGFTAARMAEAVRSVYRSLAPFP
ncbi:MAG TPA: glycosyltransferase [Gemmatimonadales bacterium]|nr:glycosyltransferase [Gemmatimonadales bacterium]